MKTSREAVSLRIDIVSDIVCPWCVIGYHQLAKALQTLQSVLLPEICWHPFELNPAMPEEGQNLRQHLAQTYGTTPEQSYAARARLSAIGESLGFHFDYHDDMRVVNTFRAHQLMDWAGDEGRQQELAMALFEAFFSHRQDINDTPTLVSIAESAGLPAEEARALLHSGRRQTRVREQQAHWLDQGVYAVPTIFLNGRFPITGAQEADVLIKKLQRVAKAA